MKLLNLTLPFYPHMPVGNVWAWDSPILINQVLSIPKQGVDSYQMSFHSETGTRLMLKATYDQSAPMLDQLDYQEFFRRKTVVIDIPKTEGEEITVADIEEKVAQDPNFNEGDAVLIRTGWGDDERYRKLGDNYAIRTPHFTVESSNKFVEVMQRKKTDLFFIDVAYVGNAGKAFMYPEWASKAPWDRPPFPSEEAKIYMRHYTPELGKGGKSTDWAPSVPLHAHLVPVVALANCQSITGKHVLMTILPLFIEGASGAPCTVVAEEI